MSEKVAEAIRQTRHTLAEKTWVPRWPFPKLGECCLLTALPGPGSLELVGSIKAQAGAMSLGQWNDRQTDVGTVLGMTLQALIAELCKTTP
jgi:hypothetical protein